MNVLAYGFEPSEISYFRLRDPMEALQKQGLAEVRSTEDMKFPNLLPRPGVDPVRARLNAAKARADAQWADVLFTQRYVRGQDAAGLHEVTEGLPWVLDIDDHILCIDQEKAVFNQYREMEPEEIGIVRPISDPADVRPGERCMQHTSGKLVAVMPKHESCRQLTYAQVVAADALIVGTREMTNIYRQIRRDYEVNNRELFRGKARPMLVYTIPYSIDPDRWENLPEPPDHNPEVWIGWNGADEHEKDLIGMVPVIEELLGRHRNLRFFWKRSNVRGLDRLAREYPERCIKFERWVAHKEWAEYCARSAFDIYLAPLVSTPFNDCRSPMKWIEAAMLRKPCVCSRAVGYEQAVKNRKTGYLCNRKSQWLRALEELIASKSLREQVGNAAREAVLASFSLTNNAALYAEAFREVKEACA